MSEKLSYTQLMEGYLKLLAVRKYKTGKGNQYKQAVREFFDFLKSRGYAYFKVTTKDMIDYHQYLCTRPNKRRGGTLSQSTINHHLFGIKILFEYLLESNLVSALPVMPKYIRNMREPLEVLSVDEIKLLYEATTSKMERALLSASYGCGLRREELAQVFLTDLDLQRGNLIVQSGKGGKRREVPLSDRVIADFKDYIHNERKTEFHTIYHLFVTRFGNAMSGYTMNEVIKRIASRVPELQSKTITLHTMRRSIATHLAENGAGIHFIKDFLGHAEIDTAQLYAIRRKRQTKIT